MPETENIKDEPIVNLYECDVKCILALYSVWIFTSSGLCTLFITMLYILWGGLNTLGASCFTPPAPFTAKEVDS